MTDHPITPPPELLQQWMTEFYGTPVVPGEACTDLATRAAQWGANQQLAKDAEWLNHNALNQPHLRIAPVGESLKEAMRPKPPSLKEQALTALESIQHRTTDPNIIEPIRRALEALDE